MSNKSDNKISAVILAAGSGTRMNSSVTKQHMLIFGESVLHRSARAFDESSFISEIVVVARADELKIVSDDLSGLKKPVKIVVGGETRAESASLGFSAIADSSKYLMMHDAARCLVTTEIVDRVALSVLKYGAATASTRITDTVKHSIDGECIESTIPREELYSAQTPQAFKPEQYFVAYDHAVKNGVDNATDECLLMETLGYTVALVEGEYSNIKMTTPEDIMLAEGLLK